MGTMVAASAAWTAAVRRDVYWDAAAPLLVPASPMTMRTCVCVCVCARASPGGRPIAHRVYNCTRLPPVRAPRAYTLRAGGRAVLAQDALRLAVQQQLVHEHREQGGHQQQKGRRAGPHRVDHRRGRALLELLVVHARVEAVARVNAQRDGVAHARQHRGAHARLERRRHLLKAAHLCTASGARAHNPLAGRGPLWKH